MKRHVAIFRELLAIGVLYAAFVPPSAADAPLVTQAGYVAYQCSQLSLGTKGPVSDQKDCSTLLTGFITGWNAGVRRGLTSAYILDQKNLLSTMGAEDAWNRIEAIQPQTQCIALNGMNFAQFVERYVFYVTARPQRAKEGFDALLNDMILETVCGH